MPVVENFGRNLRFEPKQHYAPRTDDEVLEILRRHRGERVRCAGALHSWSRILQTSDVLLDMRHFDSVGIANQGVGKARTGARVRLGAGCTIKRALDLLEPHGLTLPTVGAITKQTIAGAISTGTHGSGAPSLSHFVEEVRLAGFDPVTHEPSLLRFRGREELRAARCALGGMGVVLDVVIAARASYRVRERVEKTGSIDEVMARSEKWPLQQFILMPWKWRYVVYRRRRTRKRGSLLGRLLVRAYLWAYIDRFQHAVLWCLVRLTRARCGWLVRFFLRYLAVIPRHCRIDDSVRVLTLRHDLFRHVEMEVFVPERRLRAAVDAIRGLVELGAGRSTDLASRIATGLSRADVETVRGTWTHHYPISFRRVLPDETLISMASGTEAWVAISFFTYRLPLTAEFENFARLAAAWLVKHCEARLHWGKYFPMDFREAAKAYPEFSRFEDICRRYDPARTFWSENL